jgi:hypothetical protein
MNKKEYERLINNSSGKTLRTIEGAIREDSQLRDKSRKELLALIKVLHQYHV